MLPSELTNTIERSLCTLIGMKHISPTFMYIIPMHVFEADNIYQNPLPNVISPKKIGIFISLRGSTHDYIDCWSAQIFPAPRQLQTCARLMHGWVASRGWVPPNKNPGYATLWVNGGTNQSIFYSIADTFSVIHIHNKFTVKKQGQGDVRSYLAYQ